MNKEVKKGIDNCLIPTNSACYTEILEKHGLSGYAIAILLIQEIYKSGGFIEYSENFLQLFSYLCSINDMTKLNFISEKIQKIVQALLSCGMLDLLMFSQYNILTSKEIQTFYFSKIKTRKNIPDFPEEYLLVSIKKEEKISETSDEYKLSVFFFQLIRKNNENFKQPDLYGWAKEIQLMVEKDNRSLEDVKTIMVFATTDSFWKANILSLKKLREKYDMLYMKMKTKSKEYKRVGSFEEKTTFIN